MQTAIFGTMKTYRVCYNNLNGKISNRRRIALDLKNLYWQGRELPKDWYWFEGKIEIVSIPERGGDSVELICADDLVSTWTPKLLLDLAKQNKDLGSIEFKKGDIDYITLFCR